MLLFHYDFQLTRMQRTQDVYLVDKILRMYQIHNVWYNRLLSCFTFFWQVNNLRHNESV